VIIWFLCIDFVKLLDYFTCNMPSFGDVICSGIVGEESYTLIRESIHPYGGQLTQNRLEKDFGYSTVYYRYFSHYAWVLFPLVLKLLCVFVFYAFNCLVYV